MSESKPILVVDDDGSMRALIGALLRREGDLDVDSAATATEALEKAAEKRYEAIVLDMMLPDMSGLQFMESFEAERGERPPVIVITGASATITPDEVIRSSFQGAIYEILRKPLDQKRLVSAIREIVDRPI